jgi:hypothetical protein
MTMANAPLHRQPEEATMLEMTELGDSGDRD